MKFFFNTFVKFVRKLGYPRQFFYEFYCIPRYISNLFRYLRKGNAPAFPVTYFDLWYSTSDSMCPAGDVDNHYFLQDIWAARRVNALRHPVHVDVGSRLEGFVSHLLASNQKVTYLDWRRPSVTDQCFEFRQADIMKLPFPDNSLRSLSCLHVLEHIGLGRYGDPIDPAGYKKAAYELSRVLAPGGTLLVSVPVGSEKLCFDAHRVFSPATVLSLFSDLVLNEFSFIDPENKELRQSNDLNCLDDKEYFCGLFSFSKLLGDRVAHEK